MNDSPLFSVVTIVRNDLGGLQNTQKSLLDQTFFDFEWIVIDGLSTDGTRPYVLSLAALDSRFNPTSEKDHGIFDAMNKGLGRSKGQYVVFMNAGDVFDGKHVLHNVAKFVKEVRPADLIYGDSRENHPGMGLVYKASRGHANIAYGMFACHQSVYYQGALARAQAYNTQLKVSGDYDFTARFLQRAQTVDHIAQSLCLFDTSGVSNINKALGRHENWLVQRDSLSLGLARRTWIRTQYVASALLAEKLPWLYKYLRFSQRANATGL